MKNLTQLLFALLLLVSSHLQAQNTSDEPFINLLATPSLPSIERPTIGEPTIGGPGITGIQLNGMHLRWVASDYATWRMGVENGYTLTRYTSHLNGTLLGVDAVRSSKVVLGDNIIPLPEASWDLLLGDPDLKKVAKGVLYETDESTILSPNQQITLADAVNTEASEEARFVFALFVAEQDFTIAKGMALGYYDPFIQSGATYIYQLAINNTAISNTITINVDDTVELPTVAGLIAEGLDRAIMLEWDITNTKDHYSAYDVERSIDGVYFFPANDLPFVFASDREDDATSFVFKDSIADNSTTYYYRVCGRTPFGTKGPPSTVITIKGKPARMNLSLKINDHTETGTSATLHWDSFQEAMETEIQGFNIYRSEDPVHHFEQMNTNLLAASNRSFTDAAAIPIAYYQLEAIDQNDYTYRSAAVLVQLPDSIPPESPVGLTGKFITDDRVQLTWQANTEADLKGYRLFVANNDAAVYTQITSQAIANEQFIYEIDPTFVVDSIYFKILASDNRDNYSDKSAAFILKRPDITPPSSPVLQKTNPKPAGVEIGWRFSSSPDVAYHVLERRPANTPDWETVLTINKAAEAQYEVNQTPGSITATCYIDSSYLERREYDYRVNAYDLAGNVSSSATITIRPYDNGERGIIEAFKAKAACLPVGAIPNQAGFTVLENILSEYQYGGIINEDSLMKLVALQIITQEELDLLKVQDAYEVKVFLDKKKLEIWEGSIIAQVNLEWSYGAIEQIKDFQVYRSAEGSAIMLYKTLPLDLMNTYVFLDEDVRPDRRYYYQIIARHTDGGFSEKSKTLMVKVPKF